jgi:hypothetical protein
MTSTPTATMSSPTIRARLVCRLAGADLRPEPDDGPCRPGRDRRGAGLMVPPGGAGPGGPGGLTEPLGLTGPVVLNGPELTGPSGLTGPVVLNGPELMGPLGVTGPAGATGPVRRSGLTGLKGSAGLTGLVGPSGLVELKGSSGTAGLGGGGPGTTGSRGLAWPPRSLELRDTMRLPVTFAVSARGLFLWLRHVELGPVAYRTSACRGPGPAPPLRSRP